MKKLKIIIFSGAILIIFFQYSICYAKDYRLGIKGGINYSRFVSMEGIGIKNQNYPKYTYPADFNAGILCETEVLPYLSVRTEFSYLRLVSEIIVTGFAESSPKKELRATFIHLPIIFKFYHYKKFLPDLLFGINMGHLIYAEYRESEPVEFIDKTYQIIKDLPDFDFSAVFGISHNFELFNLSLLWEVKFLLGLTTYTYKNCYYYTGSWKNNILQFGIGIIFGKQKPDDL